MQRLHEKPDELHPIIDDLSRSSLGKIIQKAKWLLALDRYLQTILPAEFVPHCHVMNLNNGVLILSVNNAATSMRIRFMSSDLVRTLQKKSEFHNVREIQCKICIKNTETY